MKLDVDYRIINEFDISALKQEVLNLTKDDWNLDTARQFKHQAIHAMTNCYHIMEFPLEWSGCGYPSKRKTNNDGLYHSAKKISDQLETYFNGRVGRIILTKLIPNGIIRPHTDNGYYLMSSHRCHIPIVTNDNVFFSFTKETINMKSGVCYEINNGGIHSVINKSEFDRIHMIIDIIPLENFHS